MTPAPDPPPLRPGPRNALSDVAGLAVGHAHDAGARSGVTVILPDAPAVAAVDQRGGGPGTRETDLLDPANTVEAIHALVLSGGSAFGLEAAGGVAGWLAARGIGFPVGPVRVPIVPAAVLFDLLSGGETDWGETSPHRALGRTAVAAAAAAAEADPGAPVAEGTAGAGYGARAGGLKGGIGTASLVLPGLNGAPAVTVAALAAVNSLGETTMGASPAFWAWPWAVGDELGPLARPRPDGPAPGPTDHAFDVSARANTTLAVVATDLTLNKSQARRMAIMAHDGLARAIRPAHGALDGDTVFALSTARHPAPAPDQAPAMVSRCGMAAADCLARAIARAVYHATGLPGLPSYRDRFGLR